MKPGSVILVCLLIGAVTLSTTYIVTKNSGNKISCNKKCRKKPVNQQPESSSNPDELNYGSLNRLIVSTIK